MEVFCQTSKLTGSVKDAATQTPLELATVTVFGEDSSFITYQLSDKNGKFNIEKLPVKKKLRIHVSYAGYLGHESFIQPVAGKTDTLNVFLRLNTSDSLGVIVNSVIPVRMNGDTLEINPAAFKMKNDAVVEELLNQVSGITIWSDGTITVNGKKVQSLLVDGKPFMGASDSRVATQNLPKSAIEKIQLYQEYDRSNIGQPTQLQDSLLTMNIKLKENSKKGYFGKAGIGYGTSDRFESDLSFQVYTKKSSAGIGGGYNNINKNIGNLQEMFQNNTYRNFNPNLYNTGRFGTSGISKNHSIGMILTHNFIETANSRQNNRITVNYNKTGSDIYLTDLTLQNRTTINNPQFIREEGTQNSFQDRHDLGFNYVKTNSYNDNLNLTGSANSSSDRGYSTRTVEVKDTGSHLQSTNTTASKYNRRSDGESMNLSFARNNNEEPAKGFSLQLNARRNNSSSERDVKSIFQSFTSLGQNTSLNRRYASNNESLTIGGTLDYTGFKRLLLGRYNLFGINLNFTQSFSFNRFSDNTLASDYDSVIKSYIKNEDLSNRNRREITEYSPALALSRYFFKYTEVFYRTITFQVKFLEDFKKDKNSSTFDKRNLDRSFQFFRYEGSTSYQFQKRGKYRYSTSASYSKNFEYPSIDRLYAIVDNINAYDIRIGNPYLKNTTNHTINLSANFNTENPKSFYAINGNINGGLAMSFNSVTDSMINDISGKRIFYYTNGGRNKSRNLNGNFNISRKIKKNSLQFTYNGNFRVSDLPNFIDGAKNTSHTVNMSHNFSLQYSVKTIMVLTLQESFQHYRNRPTAPGLRSFENNSNTSKLGIVLNYPENFSLSSSADRVTNSNLARPFILWNSFITYRFMKQQGELKFSAMDLLKKYQNITNSVNSFGTVTRITNGLQQYFLVTFSYYPRKFGKTEIKRQGGN